MTRKVRNEELNRLSVDEFKKAEKHPVIIVLDNVRSLHNVGSAFRTADAFRIEALYLCGYTGKPPDKEIEKTALGATATVSWKYFKTTKEALEELRKNGFELVAVEQAQGSVALQKFSAKEKTALIFGNEVYGVEQEVVSVCDRVLEIPQSGSKHSLNVSVSVGIVLWELLRNRVQ
jgi:23S rRNA (guanosine2251-2'-O)-methyltransferase